MSEPYILCGPALKTEIKEQSLGQYIFDNLKRYSDQEKCMTEDHTKSVHSYKYVLEVSCRLATVFLENGYTQNDVIAISSENCISYVYPFLAAFYVGVSVAPLNDSYTERELEPLLKLSTPRVVFCSVRTLRKFLKLKSKCSFIEKIVVLDSFEPSNDWDCFFSLMSTQADSNIVEKFQPVKCDWNDTIAVIMCSSGTTGTPKNVMITHKNIIVTLENTKDPIYGMHPLLKPGDSVVNFLPLFHAFGLMTLFLQIILGFHVVIMLRYQKLRLLNIIKNYDIKGMCVTPPVISDLFKSKGSNRFSSSSLKEIFVGSNILKKDAIQAILNKTEVTSIRAGYGMTEATLVVTCTPLNDNKIGSVGKLMPDVKGKVVDVVTKKNLSFNQSGELCFKGDIIMKGYLKNEDATNEAIDEDGWLHTGDYGYYDNNGHFYVTGRLKEIISYNGYQVAPNEIEALLLEHPSIKEAAVFGIPHATAGQVPAAFVVPYVDGTLSENDVKSFIASHLSYTKRLRGGVKFVKIIPKTAIGKFNRSDLSKLFLQTSKL